jgi:CBS domain-containing protein
VPPKPPTRSLVTETVVSHLKHIPPFQFLSEAELAKLASTMSLEYFPRGAVILSAGERASDSMYIVQKGGVKLTLKTDGGEEVVLDMRSEGEIFGLLSTMGGDITRLDVTAVEDTLAYSVPGAEVQALIARHAEFAGYLLRTSVQRYMDRSLSEIRARARMVTEGEKLLYSLEVEDILRKPAITCPEMTPIQRAAQLMTSEHATCIFVVDREGRAVGIVTDEDFAKRVVAPGISLETPAKKVMSAPVVSVDRKERVFQVLLLMLSHHIHHVLVTEDGMPKAVITNHDLMLLQGKSPLNVARHVDAQETIEDICKAQERVSEMIPLLMREGAKASHITRVVAEINDRVMMRILELGEQKFGEPPVPYCWITLGSEGRREQTFKTDQDNGMIFADCEGSLRDEAEKYFEQLAVYARDGLAKCGYPPCTGGYMASNTKWRQPLSVWKTYFNAWITDAQQNRAQDAMIFFDMRPVAGSTMLHTELANYNRELLKSAQLFKSIFAWVANVYKPPLGFFRTFVVERSGQHKDEMDLKLFGTGPIVNTARLFALDAVIDPTNTIDRLTALEAMDYGDKSLMRDLQEAMEFLTLLRLERQMQQMEAGERVSNHLNPAMLSNLNRSLLKEAFQTIERGQALVESKFKTWVWAHLE